MIVWKVEYKSPLQDIVPGLGEAYYFKYDDAKAFADNFAVSEIVPIVVHHGE
jgi:hypothetical protein